MATMNGRVNVTIENGRVDGYLTVKEYALKHGVGHQQIRSLMYDGKITPLKIGHELYIREDLPYPGEVKWRRGKG